MNLPTGRSWHRFEFPRVDQSHTKVYQFQIQQLRAEATGGSEQSPVGGLVGSDDSLAEGNIVNGQEHVPDRDLLFRARATSDAWFPEFRRRINPQIPRPLRHWALQVMLLVVYNAALAIFAFHMVIAMPESD